LNCVGSSFLRDVLSKVPSIVLMGGCDSKATRVGNTCRASFAGADKSNRVIIILVI
jgi:hypothetical protein